ncbi:MAG: hypothetical protein ACREN7_05615 [Candidatus Dormibacteria bacterium]
MTLKGVVDPAMESDGYELLPGGQKLVAVELTVKNVGTGSEQDNVLVASTLLDSQGQPYPGVNAVNYTVSQCSIFAKGQVNLEVGQSSSGCVIFQIPVKTAPAEFEYEPDSGFGALGQWKLGRAGRQTGTKGEHGISLKRAGANFTKDEAPLRAALAAFGADASKWTNATTDSEAEADAQPLLDGLHAFDTKLEAQSWPAGAKWDIRSLVVGSGPIEGTLLALGTLGVAQASAWSQTFDSDLSGFVVSASLVRADLDLPPPTSGARQQL